VTTRRTDGGATPTPLQVLVGPEIVKVPRNRNWWERSIWLSRFTEYADPIESLALYAIPRALRPSTLSPLVRRTLWLYQKSLEAESEVAPEFRYYRLTNTEADHVQAAIESMQRAMPSFAYDIEPVGSDVLVDHPPSAERFFELGWTSRYQSGEIRWAEGDHQEADSAWRDLWKTLERAISEERAVARWKETYL
jgi:hypothetical protein